MAPASAEIYHARMRRVLDHIDRRLDEPLSVEALSAVAAFSKFHFHRQFSEFFGLAVHRYVLLARLRRASYWLAFRDRGSIVEIALDSGFEGPEAFARAFKRTVGQTPSAFRKQPDWDAWGAAFGPLGKVRSKHMTQTFSDDRVAIVEFPATPVAVMEHRGDPALIGDTIARFIAWRRRAGLPPKKSATFNILHCDPETTASEDFRLDLCAATGGSPFAREDGVREGLIPAGRCATLRLRGSSEDLRPAVSFLYAEWLPRSGEEPRDFPIYAQRVSFFPDVPENEAVVDIFLPLR